MAKKGDQAETLWYTKPRISLKYSKPSQLPTKLWDYMWLDWMCFWNLLPWNWYFQLGLPLIINWMADEFGTVDKDGNNFENMYALFLEKFGYGDFVLF